MPPGAVTIEAEGTEMPRAVLDAPAPPLPTLADVEAPATKDDFARVITHACARVLTLASQPRELTEAIKASREWYATLYPDTDPSKGFGGKLTGGADGGV